MRHSSRTLSSLSPAIAFVLIASNSSRGTSCPSAHTAAPRTSGLASSSNRRASSANAASPELPIAISTFRKKRSRPMRFTGDFVAARVSHESPSDRQLRIKRPDEIVRAIEQMDGVVAAAGSLVGSAVLALGSKEYSVELRGIEQLVIRHVAGAGDVAGADARPRLGRAALEAFGGAGVDHLLGAAFDVGDELLHAAHAL